MPLRTEFNAVKLGANTVADPDEAHVVRAVLRPVRGLLDRHAGQRTDRQGHHQSERGPSRLSAESDGTTR